MLRDRRIDVLELALAGVGGLVTADDLIQRMRHRTAQPISLLARWIVEHEVLAFKRPGETVIPLFLLDGPTLTPHPAAASALRELSGFFDEWESIAWFMEPNAWLEGLTPLVALRDRPDDLCAAARGARFARRG